MSLREIEIKAAYNSDEDNLLQDFYIPVLSNAIKYDRIAGYFSSNALAVAAKGIATLIKNGGQIRLIANVILSSEDQDAIKEALKKREEEVLKEIDELEDKLKKDHIKMLGWMIKTNTLEIKIAVVKNGIEHQKLGILEDSEGEKITFSGSENETVQGWLHNDELFHVFCTWKRGDEKHLLHDIERFDILWKDEGKRVRVFNASDAFKCGLIRTAPRNDQEFRRLSEYATEELLRKQVVAYSTSPKGKKVELRGYQQAAIDKWEKNGFRCLFEMATGTGKTFAALGCLELLRKYHEKLITVIACPYNHMITQWLDDMDEFGLSVKILIADSTKASWKDDLADCVSAINTDVINEFAVLTTHDTFYRDSFNILKKARCKLFVVADEVHGMWSEIRKKGFAERYEFRLGLSATPSRWFDSEGTIKLLKYFGVEDEKNKFVFSLEDAINTIDPGTGKSYLVPYEYKPIFIELTDDELALYEEKTKGIVRAYHNAKDRIEKQQYLTILCKQREDIVRNAISKYEALYKILEDIGEVCHCLVYCSPEQITSVQSILTEKGIIQHKFTQVEDTKPDQRYGSISERDYLLKNFSKGTYKALVAIRCLDEGVDIPQARIGIILASTGNPRQYIQRRGRLLRRFPGKETARIYDVIVAPSANNGLPSELGELEMKIFSKEIKRYEEFSSIASNAIECIRALSRIENRLGL